MVNKVTLVSVSALMMFISVRCLAHSQNVMSGVDKHVNMLLQGYLAICSCLLQAGRIARGEGNHPPRSLWRASSTGWLRRSTAIPGYGLQCTSNSRGPYRCMRPSSHAQSPAIVAIDFCSSSIPNAEPSRGSRPWYSAPTQTRCAIHCMGYPPCPLGFVRILVRGGILHLSGLSTSQRYFTPSSLEDSTVPQ